MKMTEREEGYEIDNTTTKPRNVVPWIVFGLLAFALVIWRFAL